MTWFRFRSLEEQPDEVSRSKLVGRAWMRSNRSFSVGRTSGSTARDEAIGVDPSGLENRAIYAWFEHETIADLLPESITWNYDTPHDLGGPVGPDDD
jgi:hypothetical protein